MDQGDMIIYFGDNHFHGVLPVKKEKRKSIYFIIFFKFEKIKI